MPCSKFSSQFWCAVNDWQTLISAFIALGAAMLTVFFIRRQILIQKKQFDAEEDRHKDQNTSKGLRARSRLPESLSQLTRYTQQCMSVLKQEELASVGEILFPSDAYTNITEAIEFVDPISAKELYHFIVHLQVQRSRLLGIDGSEKPRWHGELIYGVTLLQAYINNTFNFARDEEQVIPSDEFTNEHMHTALKNCAGFPYAFSKKAAFETCIEMIAERHAAESP